MGVGVDAVAFLLAEDGAPARGSARAFNADAGADVTAAVFRFLLCADMFVFTCRYADVSDGNVNG